MNRKEALLHVADLVTGDRATTHGEAVLQLTNVQQIKAAVGHRDSAKLTLAEIEAIDAICVKLSRLSCGTPIEDHWLDIMGYASIGVEARTLANQRPKETSELKFEPKTKKEPHPLDRGPAHPELHRPSRDSDD